MINDLRFPDHIHLIDEDISSLQRQLDVVRAAAEQSELMLNINKTKTLVFGDRSMESEIHTMGNSH